MPDRHKITIALLYKGFDSLPGCFGDPVAGRRMPDGFSDGVYSIVGLMRRIVDPEIVSSNLTTHPF